MNDTELQQVAYRLKQALDESTDGLSHDILDDLRKRRSVALTAYAKRHENQNNWRLAQALTFAASPLRNLAIVTALSLGLVGTYYWDQLDLATENEEIDSALLADELPPEIYSDSGFHTWLERSRSSSSP